MFKLDGAEFPSKYLECYESVLITILKYLGLAEETPLMGTQAYFVVEEDGLRFSPRFNAIEEEWKRIHDLEVETLTVANETDLRDAILNYLNDGLPVCLPVDLYSLQHTPYYNYLHWVHHVALFGYKDDGYYMVCPYYRFMGWVDKATIHGSFFSPHTDHERRLQFIPQLKLKQLSFETVHDLVRENCQYMLGLRIPETLTGMNPEYLGLAGIRTLSELGRQMMSGPETRELPGALLDASTQIRGIGYSRHWFCKLVQTCEDQLLPQDVAADLYQQFATVTKSWEDIGVKVGAGVYGSRPEMVAQAILQLERVRALEERLFNNLLGALPDYQTGTL